MDKCGPVDAIGPCERCGGSGAIEWVEYVTHDMATDAGEPDMEGMPMPYSTECPDCGGSGKTVRDA